jgi:hypothetical protein
VSDKQPLTEDQLEAKRLINNPNGELTGHFTGRCGNCGSTDLWSDGMTYGCNDCGSDFFTQDLAPRMIENGTGRDLGPAW